MAHGGHCVARHEGRVVFVRHALPGERVLAVVTEGGPTAAYWRADAVRILEASPDRVSPPCPYARPGQCGGCDWQHVALPAQRELKAAVVREQLAHLAGLAVDVVVEPVPGDGDGLGWRSRVSWAVDAQGRAGLHRYRSDEVVPVRDCRIAAPAVGDLDVPGRRWPGVERVVAVASSAGDRAVVAHPAGDAARLRLPRLDRDVSVVVEPPDGPARNVRGRLRVSERAAGRTYEVSAGGFWQVHRGAAGLLVDAVLGAVEPRPGERVLDLYSGAGLFAAALAGAVGPAGTVVAVESDGRACADARRNLHDLPQVRLVRGLVDRVLPRLGLAGVDAVVLDPPRSGARRAVVRSVTGLAPRAVCYVACDPAALARDVATFQEHGYRLTSLRAFDLFPMTAHVECLALLVPGGGRD